MIKSKTDYLHYLKEDQKALGAFTKHPVFSDNMMILLTDPCWKFEKLMRKLEYWTNCKTRLIDKPYLWILRKKYQRLSIRLGFSIPINIFEEGLCIGHYGSVVVSRHAKVGRYCTIHSCVNIGGTPDKKSATIGDYCFIGPGAKLFNDITLADHIKIGANSVVNKSFHEKGVTIAGVPAKIVSRNEQA
ncbi:serine acetyltransferase [Sporolactobacillus sp. CPB3-1]|uniref:Serine acetyltransferase n=1 Tax=Sporolactobacillus mangiferae TaxID=2940498 RepID=A0ABT0MBP1_9BACL|nr:serine acetyltransferase [Sporolactobacillus mangiferae]MCL1632285.1 serine acetyltransferase [Sporolactobacillus mangiferae]